MPHLSYHQHMKRVLILAVVASAFCSAQPDPGCPPAPSNAGGALYPRLRSYLRVTFRMVAPDAHNVLVASNNSDGGIKGPVDLVRDQSGAWSVTVGPVVPGFHYYWYVVDGVELSDPSSESYFGHNKELSGVEVPEKGTDFYDVGNVPHGDVRIVYSTLLSGHGKSCGSGSTCSTSNRSAIGVAVAVDPAGNAYLAGSTFDPWFPATPGAWRTAFAGPAPAYPYDTWPPTDAFVAKINPTGTALVWASYLVGKAADVPRSAALDPSGNLWLSGVTASPDFPNAQVRGEADSNLATGWHRPGPHRWNTGRPPRG